MTLLLIGGACILLAYLAWRWPDWAVALLVLTIPLYVLRVTIFDIPTTAWELAVATVFFVGATQLDTRRSWRQSASVLPRAFIVFALLFVAGGAIGLYVSEVPVVSLGILKGWILAPMLAAWLVYDRARWSQRTRELLLDTLLASGAIIALLSLTQLESGQRLAGIYDVPNSLALWLAPLTTLAVARLIVSRRTILVLPIVIMVIALIATVSVAGIFSVLFSIGLAGVLWSPRPLLSAGILIVCVALGVGVLQNSLDSQASLAVRKQLWSVSGELIGKSPIVGVGLGQFEPHYQRVLHQRFWDAERQGEGPAPLREFVFRDPHNWPLSFWLNSGLLGLIGFIGVHTVALHRTSNRAAAAALICLLLFGLVDTIYWKNDLAALQWLLLVILLP